MDAQHTGSAGWGPVPVRLVVGLVFLVHGMQKLLFFGLAGTAAFMGHVGIPLPTLAAAVVMAVETLGGLALIVGLFTRWAAALLAIDMLVAMLTVHLRAGFFVPHGVEFTLTLFGASLSLALLGPGAWSLDQALGRRRF